jgi:hypothetical protein
MAKLTAAKRNRLPASAFLGPASQHASPELRAKIKAKVRRRYPGIHVEGAPSKHRADRPSRRG